MIVAHPSFPASTVAELIELARKEPGKHSYASAGPGTAQHLSMELFKLQAKLDIVHIPYKGSGPAMADLLGGHVKLMMDSTASSLGAIRDGRIKALGVTTARRAPLLDNVPPIGETVPGYDSAGWSGLVAPAKTPDEIVNKVNADLVALMRDPAVLRQFEERATLGRADDAGRVRSLHGQGHGDLGRGGEGDGDEAGHLDFLPVADREGEVPAKRAEGS